MSCYAVAPLFLIRAAGVAFDRLEGLSTTGTSSLAREVLTAREGFNKTKEDVEALLNRRGHGLAEEEFRAWRKALRAGAVPSAVESAAGVFATYARAAGELETAEKRLTETFASEFEKAREKLFQSAIAVLPRYLVFAGAGVQELLQLLLRSESLPLAPRNARAGDRERHIFMYLQRVCAKNDTFSAFGPSAWGKVDSTPGSRRFEIRQGEIVVDAYLERWTAHAVAAALNADLSIRPEIAPSGAGVRVPALDPHPFETLLDDVRHWRDDAARSRWLETLEPLAALPATFAASLDPERRIQVMAEARDRLTKLGHGPRVGRSLYAATNPIGEECSRADALVIGEQPIGALLRDAEPWIDLWRDTYAFVADRVAAGLRRLLKTAPVDNGAVALPVFLRHCAEQEMSLEHHGIVALATIAFQEVKSAFREHVSARPDAPQWQLTADDCHFLRDKFEFPKFDEYTYPSADLQISATSCEAIERGEFEWIVSELHPPVAMLHHCFYWNCPDRVALSRALASTAFGKPNFHFGFFAADFTSHTAVRIFDALPDLSVFVAPQRGHPHWKTVAPAEAEVYIDDATGDVRLRERGSHTYLGSFARAWLIPLGFHPFNFGRAPHMPRLRCGEVIVQRRSWTVTEDEARLHGYTGVSRDLVIAMEQLRAARDLPRYVYIRPTEQALRRSGAEGRDKDTKPVFIDLESYMSIEIFQRWLHKAGEIEVTEMLPDPDHLCWQEADGRRTFELRTLIVPRS